MRCGQMRCSHATEFRCFWCSVFLVFGMFATRILRFFGVHSALRILRSLVVFVAPGGQTISVFVGQPANKSTRKRNQNKCLK